MVRPLGGLIMAALLLVLLAGCSNSDRRAPGDAVPSEGAASPEQSNRTESPGGQEAAVDSGNNQGQVEQEAPATGGIALESRKPIHPLGADVMPIGAWVAPPPSGMFGHDNPDYITSDSYRLAKEAGLNIVYGLYERVEIDPAQVLRALDYAHEHGLKYLVSDSAIQAGADDPELMRYSLDTYRGHPAYLGNLAVDEPASAYFDSLGASHDAFAELDPDKYFYINLLPNYASVNQLFVDKLDETGGLPTAAQYRQYLDAYMDAVKPTFISYDYYPLHGTFPALTQGYYDNLSVVRKTASEHGIPFWVFIQSASWNVNARLPIRSETFWQVNTALAYGAQGIQYFTFWCPFEDGFTGGMVSRNGEKTPIYDDVQEMNRQIAAIDHVLMGARFKGVIVHGESSVPVPEDDQLPSYGALAALSGDIPVIAGAFDYDGTQAYYVVNNTIDRDGKATLRWTGEHTLQVVQGAESSRHSGSVLELALAAGEGALVVIRQAEYR
jgi:hypothetical protein